MVHPDIVRILKQVRSRHESYKDKWPLLVQITSNLVIGPKTLGRVIDLVDDWTFSFHAESLPKQQELALKNLKFLHLEKTLKVVTVRPQIQCHSVVLMMMLQNEILQSTLCIFH